MVQSEKGQRKDELSVGMVHQRKGREEKQEQHWRGGERERHSDISRRDITVNATVNATVISATVNARVNAAVNATVISATVNATVNAAVNATVISRRDIKRKGRILFKGKLTLKCA